MIKVFRPLTFPRQPAMAALVVVLSFVSFSAMLVQAQDEDRTAEAIALFNKGQDAHEKGDLTEAIRLYDQALAIIPEFPEAELQRGNAFLSLSRVNDAEKAFRHAVEIRKDWTIALAALGSALVQKGQFSEAEKYLTNAIQLDELNFPAYAALAELRIKTNADRASLQALLEKIKALTEKARPPASAWAARAALERALGATAAAKQSLASALELEPKNRTALAESGLLALSANDPTGAESYVKRLEDIAPDSETAKVLRARILLAQGKLDEGSKVLDTLRNPGPEISALKSNIAAARSTDPVELETQLKNDPKNAVALGRLCSTLRTSEPERAVDYCRRAVEADNGNVTYAIGYGAALLQAKRYSDAAAVLTRLVAIAPDNATAHANLATALFQLKRYPEAKTEYQWLVERQPNLAAAYYFLAISYDELGEYLDAMANYQQFLRLADPVASKLEIEKVNLRLPVLQKQLKDGKGKKNG